MACQNEIRLVKEKYNKVSELYQEKYEGKWNSNKVTIYLTMNSGQDFFFSRSWKNKNLSQTKDARMVQLMQNIYGKKYASMFYLANIDLGPNVQYTIEMLRKSAMLPDNSIYRQDICAIRLKNFRRTQVIIVTAFHPCWRTIPARPDGFIAEYPGKIKIVIRYLDEAMGMHIDISQPQFAKVCAKDIPKYADNIMKEIRVIDSFFA